MPALSSFTCPCCGTTFEVPAVKLPPGSANPRKIMRIGSEDPIQIRTYLLDESEKGYKVKTARGEGSFEYGEVWIPKSLMTDLVTLSKADDPKAHDIIQFKIPQWLVYNKRLRDFIVR